MAARTLCATRKSFIGGMLAAGSVPAIVPHSVLGENAPSNRVTVGGIGVDGIGKAQLPQIKKSPTSTAGR